MSEELVSFFAVAFAASRATFCDHIGHIVSLCTKKKMIGINTNWIIALVTNKVAVWDRAIMQFIGEAVSITRLAILLYFSIDR